MYNEAFKIGIGVNSSRTPSKISIPPSAFSNLSKDELLYDQNRINFVSGQPQNCSAVFFSSGDESYVRNFLSIYANSLFDNVSDPNMKMHIHVFDSSPDFIDECIDFAKKFGKGEIFFSTEVTKSGKNKSYYYIGRFVVAPLIMKRYECPIIITDIDCAYVRNVSHLINDIDKIDFGFCRHGYYHHPWSNFRANLVVFCPSIHGYKICKAISNFLYLMPADKTNFWYVDQMALATAFYSQSCFDGCRMDNVSSAYNRICYQPTGSTGNPAAKAERTMSFLKQFSG